jgi:small subunit ribosomal protein S17
MTKTINSETTIKSKKRVLTGVVTSDKMTDTITVKVDRYVKLPKYNKYVTISKKFKAHDAGNTAKIGDKVSIVESAPISKDKHFTLVK